MNDLQKDNVELRKQVREEYYPILSYKDLVLLYCEEMHSNGKNQLGKVIEKEN